MAYTLSRWHTERQSMRLSWHLAYRSFSSSTPSRGMESIQDWHPPAEPRKPPLPYAKGSRLQLRRVIPPLPFTGRYSRHAPEDLMSFIKNSRASSRAYLKSTTLVEHCLSSVPLPSQKLDETAAVEIVDTISVGDGKGGAQIVVCTTPPSISDVPVVAKIYDPLYDMFMNDRFPGIPRDPIARADSDFTTESAAYAELDPKLGGGLIPRYHGSWMLELPLLGRSRVVYLVLMEKVIGVSLDRFPRAAKDFSRNERLNVMRRVMEADTAIDFAGAVHDDLAPRNVICDRKDLSDPELGIRVIDFNTAQIYRLLGSQAPCTTYMLPESPVRRYWDDHVVEMGDWAEDYYDNEEAWRSWLVETWGTSDAYQPVEPEFLSQDR